MEQIEVGFIGYNSADMTFYLARLFSAAGKRVAVIDHTKKLPLLRAASLPEELAQSTGFYKDILMINGAMEHKKDKACQDVVLHYFGYHHEHVEVKQCQYIVYVTDMAMSNAQLLHEVKIAENTSAYLIIRNYASFKYNEKYLCQIIGRTFDTEKMFLIPFDESDYKSGCYLCVDKKHKLTSLSGEMKTAVFSLFSNIMGVEYKRKEKAALLKRA